MRIRFAIYEFDIVAVTRGERLGTYDDRTLAHEVAKKLARAWCEDEEPERILVVKGVEAYIGHSDFGVMIVPTR